jgi:hypothetical protein
MKRIAAVLIALSSIAHVALAQNKQATKIPKLPTRID